MSTIKNYSFGNIVINNKNYSADIIIHTDESLDTPWRRQESHYMTITDIPTVLEKLPEILIIGTGAVDIMKIDEKMLSSLKQRGIEVHIARTKQATKIYNDLSKTKKVCGCFHLTC
jgi:hypothetical protein